MDKVKAISEIAALKNELNDVKERLKKALSVMKAYSTGKVQYDNGFFRIDAIKSVRLSEAGSVLVYTDHKEVIYLDDDYQYLLML